MVDNSTMTECQLGKIVWDDECTGVLNRELHVSSSNHFLCLCSNYASFIGEKILLKDLLKNFITTAGSSPLPTCELDSKLCDVPGHIRCLEDELCDINQDCPNGSDEDLCGMVVSANIIFCKIRTVTIFHLVYGTLHRCYLRHLPIPIVFVRSFAGVTVARTTGNRYVPKPTPPERQ